MHLTTQGAGSKPSRKKDVQNHQERRMSIIACVNRIEGSANQLAVVQSPISDSDLVMKMTIYFPSIDGKSNILCEKRVNQTCPSKNRSSGKDMSVNIKMRALSNK